MATLSEHQRIHRGKKCCRYRTAEHEARRILERMGFSAVVRVIDPSVPVSVVAWSVTGGVHVFRVVSTRRTIANASEAAALFRDEIEQLREVPRTVGGSVNPGVRTGRNGWRMYRAFPGGIINVEAPDVARDWGRHHVRSEDLPPHVGLAEGRPLPGEELRRGISTHAHGRDALVLRADRGPPWRDGGAVLHARLPGRVSR